MTTPTVLVTGPTGLVGSALCPLLVEKDFFLRVAVRGGVGPLLKSLPRASLETVGEIGPETGWQPALQDVTCVVHLAARTHVMRETAANPIAEYRKVNVAGTERLAGEAARAGVRRFVYLSSIKVNGEATFDCHSPRLIRRVRRMLTVSPSGRRDGLCAGSQGKRN